MKRKYFLPVILILMSILFANTATTQQYTSEPRTVYVGYQLGKYAPDSAGVINAVAKAKAIQESLHGFVTIDIAPGCEIDLGDSCIVLPDSVLFISSPGASITSDYAAGTLIDNNIQIYSKLYGDFIISNTNGNDKRIVLINASSDVKVISYTPIAGTNYINVYGTGTPAANAAELQAVYDLAQTLTPNGAALSTSNRIKIVVSPGTYTFTTPFVVDAEFIDIVSLTGDADVMLDGINVTADDVYLKGINTGAVAFTIATNLSSLICENCVGGGNSFGGSGSTASGTFISCIGGVASFGGDGGTASGTFTNCTSSDLSFGGYGIASGTFINCTATDYSFGCYGTASGTFKSCTATDYSFGGGGAASGTFYNCIGGDVSFGGEGTLTGKLYWCKLTWGTFTTVSGAGQTRMCLDSGNVLNNQG